MEKEISLAALYEGIRLDASSIGFTLPFILRDDMSPRRLGRKRRESSLTCDVRCVGSRTHFNKLEIHTRTYPPFLVTHSLIHKLTLKSITQRNARTTARGAHEKGVRVVRGSLQETQDQEGVFEFERGCKTVTSEKASNE